MSLLDFVSLPQCPIAQTRTRACERNASRADVGVEQAENRVSESGVVSGRGKIRLSRGSMEREVVGP